MAAARRAVTGRAGALIVLLAVVAVLLGAGAPPAPPRAAAPAPMPASILDGGTLISDAAMFDAGALTVRQIRAFLRGQEPACAPGATCLDAYRQDTPAVAADAFCAGIPARHAADAAEIVAAAATACRINPAVLLVMLQKEQGLVTASAPAPAQYAYAMGYSCPDTPAGCAADAAGFFRQVYGAARQLRVYVQDPGDFGYRAGRVNTVPWDVGTACGTSRVIIRNRATAALYDYTPYRPDIAALAAGWGTGDACSAYGNRNFYNLFVAWFAPYAVVGADAPAQVPACTTPGPSDLTTVRTTATVRSDTVVRAAPSPSCRLRAVTVPAGRRLTVTAVYSGWARVRDGDTPGWLPRSCLSGGVVPPGGHDACPGPQPASGLAATVRH